MNEIQYLAYRVAEESIRGYGGVFTKTAGLPLLAGLVPWLKPFLLRFLLPTTGTALVFTGTGHALHNLPYMTSKLTGRGAGPMTSEEEEIYRQLSSKSPKYAYEKAVATVAAKYGLASYLDDGTPLVNLSVDERQALYDKQRKKGELVEHLLAESQRPKEEMEFGPWGPTWEQLDKLRWSMPQPDIDFGLGTGTRTLG